MATSYLTPGVYVEEMPPGSRPIEGVGTSVAAFVGFAEMGPRAKPTLITNWSQFVDKFGGFVDGYYLAYSVYGYFLNGGGVCYVVNIAPSLAPQIVVPANGSKDGKSTSLEVYATRAGLAKTAKVTVSISYDNGGVAPPKATATNGAAPTPAPTTIAVSTPFLITVKNNGNVVETFEKATMDRESPSYVETMVNSQSQWIWLTPPAGKVAVLPSPTAGDYGLQAPASTAIQVTTSDFTGNVVDRSGIEGLEAIDEVTIVCVPDIWSAVKKGLVADIAAAAALQKAVVDHCERLQSRVAIIDPPPGLDAQGVDTWRNTTGEGDFTSSYATVYYPWIKVLDPLDPTGKYPLTLPPSGHIAGVWARTDSQRGVHKAPANETIRGALNVAQDITDGEQSILNPEGVNCIRPFGSYGIRIWGARTTSSDAAWKYINVRRFFNYVEQSIKRGTRWAVFEPNDFSLWQQLRRDVSAFLMRPYRDGALFGLTPDQAFFVKCDAETNPPDQIDAGMVVVVVGMCPVKPAEFVIFRVQQLPTGG